MGPLLPTLAAAHSVTMIDAIGEPGKSIATKPITNITQKVEWLDETLRAVDIERSAIVAASHGTLIATHYTMAFPDRVDRLALVCPVGIVSSVRLSKLVRALTTGGVRPTERRIQSLLDATVMPTNRRVASSGAVAANHAAIHQLAPSVSSLPAAIYRSVAICNGSHRPKFQFWRSSAGMNTSHSGPKMATRFRQQLPEARIELVDDANHSVFVDQFDIVEKLLADFLKVGIQPRAARPEVTHQIHRLSCQGERSLRAPVKPRNETNCR